MGHVRSLIIKIVCPCIDLIINSQASGLIHLKVFYNQCPIGSSI